jgi:hypothetical protein
MWLPRNYAIWSVVLFDGSDEGVLKSESLIASGAKQLIGHT